MDTLFTMEPPAQSWVVRHAVTSQEFYRSADPTDCELWCDNNPQQTWLVIEHAYQLLPLDEYLLRGMLRNYPGERPRATNAQLDLFAAI